MTDTTVSKDVIVIERTFDAPIEVVWDMDRGKTFPTLVWAKRLYYPSCPDGFTTWRQAPYLYGAS
jgi:hypothetical protein